MTSGLHLTDVVRRPPLRPWSDGGKIPWHEPGFSRRMLHEHLTQEHERASRPAPAIAAEVAWLHESLLGGRPSRVLDLGCGPGLYTSALARRGHTCTGVDFGPASIAHARETAHGEGLDCTYIEADLRAASFGDGHDLALLIQGELHTFPRPEAAALLAKIAAALRPGGRLVLEALRWEIVEAIGVQRGRWSTVDAGLWSDAPYIELYESAWDATEAVSMERWHIIDAASGSVSRYASTTQAYTEAELASMLDRAGLTPREGYDGWPGVGPGGGPFVLIVADRR